VLVGALQRSPLAPTDEFCRDSDLVAEEVQNAQTQQLYRDAMSRGLQTREAEMQLAGFSDVGDAGR
jgi:hypothetical protein